MRIIKLTILTTFCVAFLWAADSAWQPDDEMSCCATNGAAMAADDVPLLKLPRPGAAMAQDRPKEDKEDPDDVPGNPDHDSNRKCAAVADAAKNIHACKCAKYRKCDDSEPPQCKAWCFAKNCGCPSPCT